MAATPDITTVAKSLGLGAFALLFSAAAASAASVTPTSYTMLNGESASFTYFDDAYNGTGNKATPLALLSGGTGDLTDGIIASGNWFQTPSLYVGWNSIDPTISFFFDQVYNFNSVTFYFDDSNGSGGVSPPQSVSVNGVFRSIPDSPIGTPYSFTAVVSDLISPTDMLVVNFQRRIPWMMLSEVQFDGEPLTPVPVPAGFPLLLTAVGALAWMRRRKSKS